MLPRGVEEMLRRLLVANSAFCSVYLIFLAATGRAPLWAAVPLSIVVAAYGLVISVL